MGVPVIPRRYRPRVAHVRFNVVPRRSRVLLLTVLIVCALTLLPRARGKIGELVWFLFFAPLGYKSSTYSLRLGGSRSGNDILRFVDPLIGTTNGGHVFPGATLPYGMAKAVADTDSRAENAAGYVSDNSAVIGFSHTHDSGTGGSPSMGNFPVFVHPGCPDDDFARCEFSQMVRGVLRRNGTAKASPGYFGIGLQNGIDAEMTATMHAALYRFSFPRPGAGKGARNVTYPTREGGNETVPFSPLVLVDLVDLMNSRSAGGIQIYPESGRIIGDGTYAPSFGQGRYSAFFCADFRTTASIRRTGTFVGSQAAEKPKYLGGADGGNGGATSPSGSAGAWIQFGPEAETLMVRVGVSFRSTDQACANAETELAGWRFGATVRAAEDAWREKLSAVQVDAAGVSEELQTTFWSGLYRSLLSPQNYTGENQLWDSTEPYFDSFYCIWDSYRAQHPLLTIVDPPAQAEMVRALIDIYRHEGKLPDCRMSFCKGYTQGGSNADVVIADAFAKNITEGIDWETAYEAVKSDAEHEPKDWGVGGRGNLVSYHALGYIPYDDDDRNGTGPNSRSVSRLVEYAYDDFCIGNLAAALGKKKDAERYHARGANWMRVWNPEQRDIFRDKAGDVMQTHFKGFVQPRGVDGNWRYANTRLCSPVHEQHLCYYDTHHPVYEGNPWLYSFYAPQDMRTLVKLMGGRDKFVERLSFFHSSGIIYMGNEQSFLPVFQFHYGGRPGLSSHWAHEYIPGIFNTSVNGIPGNDDCAMGAFSALTMMGFFPVAGQDVYLIIPPFFPEVRLRARVKRRHAIIRVVNFDPTYMAKYIVKATLDGQPLTRSWITHDFFLNGGLLELEVGEKEGDWGTSEKDLPPSFYEGMDGEIDRILRGKMLKNPGRGIGGAGGSFDEDEE